MADMNTAITLTIEHEGGFQKDKNDHANWSSGIIGQGTLVGTKYGITALDMPGVDIENLTIPQAVAFYEKKFWNVLYGELISQTIANKLFDMGVLFGEETAVKQFQTVLDVKIDGLFGQVSLVRTNAANSTLILSEYKVAMKAHAASVAAANPKEAGDLPGWETRIDS